MHPLLRRRVITLLLLYPTDLHCSFARRSFNHDYCHYGHEVQCHTDEDFFLIMVKSSHPLVLCRYPIITLYITLLPPIYEPICVWRTNLSY